MITIEFFPEWKTKGKWLRFNGGTIDDARNFIEYYFNRSPEWKFIHGDETCETRIIKRTVIEDVVK